MIQDSTGYASRVPLRISFAGGGTDVEPYPSRYGGIVLSSTIATYVHADIWETNNDYVQIQSIDTGNVFKIDPEQDNDSMAKSLLTACLAFQPKKSREKFSISVRSMVPPGSGLGASSAIAVAILGALDVYREEKVDPNRLANNALKIEREILKIAGGYQDQFACSYGGFNQIEFNSNKLVSVKPLKLAKDFIAELEHDLLLFWTGNTRQSDGIIKDQTKNLQKGVNLEALHKQKEIARSMLNAFQSRNLHEIGNLLDLGWQYKKKYSKLISNTGIDRIYEKAISAGAVGGKLLGAGGGGFLLIMTRRNRRQQVVDELRSLNLLEFPIVFTDEGIQTWRTTF